MAADLQQEITVSEDSCCRMQMKTGSYSAVILLILLSITVAEALDQAHVAYISRFHSCPTDIILNKLVLLPRLAQIIIIQFFPNNNR